MIVYLNGRYLPREEARISPEDRGFLFADAIYEVVRFGAGRPYRLKEHLERMADGLTAIRIPADPSFFPAVASRLLAENGLDKEDALVYAQVSRGAAPRYHAFPPEGTPLRYGQSITDGCVDLDVTARMLEQLAEAVESRPTV